MHDLWQDVRYGARMLRRAPGFAVVVAAILALGIGANSAIFSVVNAVLLRPLPYRDPARLVRVDETDPKGEARGVSPAAMLLLAQRAHAFEDIAVSRWQNLTLTGPEGAENVFGGLVSPSAFRMLGTQPSLGRVFRTDEFNPAAPDAVVLSARLWRRRFGANPAVLGRTLLDERQAVHHRGHHAGRFPPRPAIRAVDPVEIHRRRNLRPLRPHHLHRAPASRRHAPAGEIRSAVRSSGRTAPATPAKAGVCASHRWPNR